MTTLNFRILVPFSQEEPNIESLKTLVESCGVIVQSIQRTQNAQEENCAAGIISEYSLDIVSVNEYCISNRDKVQLYGDLHLIHPPLFMSLTPWRLRPNPLQPFNRQLNDDNFDIFHICPFNVTKDVIGKSSVLRVKFRGWDDFEDVLTCLRFRCEKLPVNFVKMDVIEKDPPQTPEVSLPHFGCAYLLEAMVKRSFNILEQADSDTSFRKLEELCAYDPRCLEKALSDVLFAMDSGKLINFWKTIETQFVHYKREKGPRSINEYVVPAKCRLIRRVTFTPTRTLLWPAELMCENRILRNFDSEYFLRVTFRDDDMLTMNFRRYDFQMFVETIQKPMNSGLKIGSRKYELLAWSSSQLREHGVSMYARDSKGRTATDIRNWVEISPNTSMNVPKCLARIGQCFSQTEDTLRVPLDNRYVLVENDVEGGRNPLTLKPYCFTDGVGKISVKLANQVRNILRHDKDCSAFQIRYSGFKGMLVIDPTLEDADIVFRQSMEKFCSRGDGHTKLEIAKPSSPIRLRLNRPLIAILNDLDVPHGVFLRMQEEMLKILTDMLIDEEVARNYLNARTPFSDLKFKELSQSGVGLTAEPFFRTLLLALHRYYIDLVKTKANIDVDPSEGRNMFGVSDETGMLNYGEVFVQYSRDVTNNVTTPDDAIILTGPVMVTKCPCVHPGDVRKFTAVDVPALRHIVDCIVFPQRGPRPHPDEIS
ncbi:uncharacterized protein LOC129233351, partial [Uloborus diversus]|uniref:uncharacterized protein LOC129233351 n=1 Tax=Uloborus diversus TaxID=327109 RepID=UPI00240A9B2F